MSQQDEIKTIKKREICLNLSDADVQRICEKAGAVGLSVSNLLGNFIGDLVYGTHTNGSDERMYAEQWFERCGFGMFPDKTFLRFLIENEGIENTIREWNDLQECKNDLKEYNEQAKLDEDDKECISGIEENISELEEDLKFAWDEYKEYGGEGESLEEEMLKVMEWYKEMERLKKGTA